MNDENFHRLKDLRAAKNRLHQKRRTVKYTPKRSAIVDKHKREEAVDDFDADLYWGRWLKYANDET